MTNIPEDIKRVADEIHFDAIQFWVPGNFDKPECLLEAFKSNSGFEDYEDERGNIQSAIRLDYDPDNPTGGLWVTLPTKANQTIVDAAVAEYPNKVTEVDNVVPQQDQAVEMFIRAADAIENATDLADIKAAFAGIKADLLTPSQ